MTTTAVQETRGRVGRNDRGLVANAVDIRRFSTHDGTGIRTTIFLKGCTLACRWCQNPETISGRIHPVFFPSRCIDCGLCVQAAGDGEVRREEDGRIVVDTTRESDWRALAAVCPANAITFDGSRYTVEDLVTLALRDKPFFRDKVDEFLDFIRGAELIIHNAAFDVGFLDAELKMAGPQYGRITDHATVLVAETALVHVEATAVAMRLGRRVHGRGGAGGGRRRCILGDHERSRSGHQHGQRGSKQGVAVHGESPWWVSRKTRRPRAR